LTNGKAVGPDDISAELMKYCGNEPYRHLSVIYNRMIIDQEVIPALGAGLLVPLNKSGKPKIIENIRPITLLNSSRKMVSLLTLERLSPDAEQFIDPSQCGFRRGRSSAEVIWTYAWVKANAWRYQRTFYIQGIDMSKAFDTVLRMRLLWIIEQIASEDVARLIRILMSKTHWALGSRPRSASRKATASPPSSSSST
jgi:hypothetical protein